MKVYKPGLTRALHKDWFKTLLGFVFIFLLSVLISPYDSKGNNVFLKVDNLVNILRQVSEIGIISVGMTVVIITGGIDLSVGSVLALSATITAFGLMDWQLGLLLTLLFALTSGALAGFVNGIVVSMGKIQSFIASLAMMTIARGFALLISGNTSRNIGYGEGAAPESFRVFTSTIFGVPFPVYIFLLSVVLFVIILNKTVIGRYFYAIGSNEEAARLAGIKVGRIKIIAFSICGLLSAISGIIHAAQLYQGNPNDGVGFELDAIAAAVIGGTSLAGGKGTVEGTFLGVLIIGLLSNILGLHGIQKDLQFILKGLIIVSAVIIQERAYRLRFVR